MNLFSFPPSKKNFLMKFPYSNLLKEGNLQKEMCSMCHNVITKKLTVIICSRLCKKFNKSE